jgi:DNA repair exonuclease SbcCD ATPase subunit
MSEAVTEVENSTEPSHLEDMFNAGETPVDETEETQGLNNAVEDNTEETATEEEPQETNDELSELRSQLEALQQSMESKDKQILNAQDLINRQGNELGNLRKVTLEPKEEKSPEDFLNEFADDPVKAQQELIKNELEKRELARAEKEQQIAQNRSAVLNLVPDFESKMDSYKEWYKSKGASDDFVSSLSASSLYNNVDLAVALGEIQNLKGQLAETESKTTNVIDKLNKGGAVVSSKSGQAASSDSTIKLAGNVADMSDKQLEAMLAKSA